MNRANRTLAICLAPALLLVGTLVGTALLQSPTQADRPYYSDGGPQLRGTLNWSGDVDDTTIVSIHAGDVRTRTVHGKDANNINTQFFGRLPRGPVEVFLRQRDGRGSIRVVQQPNPDNDFTAAVRIHDPQSGRSHYNFVLAWRPLPLPAGVGGYRF